MADHVFTELWKQDVCDLCQTVFDTAAPHVCNAIVWNGFDNAENLYSSWTGSREGLVDATVLFVAYDYESYSGEAIAIFWKDSKLYEAHCSHCSCNGLDEFRPEETSFEALMMQRMVSSNRQCVDALHRFFNSKGADVAVRRSIERRPVARVPGERTRK